MSPNQLHPLELNKQTQEPFLRLKNHRNIILTPIRADDRDHIIPILNDSRVSPWVFRPPFPYLKAEGVQSDQTIEHADEWLRTSLPACNKALAELNIAQGSDILKTVNDCPLASIREIQEDGTDVYIGNLQIDRCFNDELLDAELPGWEKLSKKAIEELEVGDTRIIWTIGDYLAPSHHGKGIMSDAIGTLLSDWAIPRMNVHKILVGAFSANVASRRVFEKNGFELISSHNVKSDVRGKGRPVDVLGWKQEEKQKQ
ncbi:hypothetical protein BJ165DRAFT_1398744 [Panaeolus papilionaceus]|nr:hypothetical protein BJ165DRAFT_1398744 [Panaeolus papilionaceus]